MLILCLFSLQFQFKEIVLTEEEKRLLSKEGATIPTHMPLTKVIDVDLFELIVVVILSSIVILWIRTSAKCCKCLYNNEHNQTTCC